MIKQLHKDHHPEMPVPVGARCKYVTVALTARHQVQAVGVDGEACHSVQVSHHGVGQLPWSQTQTPQYTSCSLQTLSLQGLVLYLYRDRGWCCISTETGAGGASLLPPVPVLLSKNLMCRSSWAVMVMGRVGWLRTLLIWQGVPGERERRNTYLHPNLPCLNSPSPPKHTAAVCTEGLIEQRLL